MDLYAIIGAIVAVIVALAGTYIKGKSAGKNEAENKTRKANEATQREFDKIDNQTPNIDASIDRLRDRSKRPGP